MDTRQKVLLVDDDPDLCDMYREILAQLPAPPEVHTAISGPRALAMLETEPFDLLICDLMMPKMGGLQVLAVVRQAYPQLRTLIQTAEIDERFRHRAYALGVDLYCHYPATEQETQVWLEQVQFLLGRECLQPHTNRLLRVVVLDDEEILRDCYRLMLRSWYEGVVVVQCDTGDEAWQELSRVEPNLFITDRAHTGMSCGEMLERLAARKAKFPIFLISAGVSFLGEAALRSANENLNFSSFHKPVEVDQLRQALETALRLPANQ